LKSQCWQNLLEYFKAWYCGAAMPECADIRNLRIRLDETASVDSKSLWMKFLGKGQDFTTLLGGGLAVFLFASAAAQDRYYGAGHDKWHQNFYSKLKRNDGQGSCCNLMDCRPTKVAWLATVRLRYAFQRSTCTRSTSPNVVSK
jgi:hypothetical protein